MTSLGELLEGENVDSYCWRLSIDALNRLVSRGWVLAEEDAEALAIIDESLRRQREVRPLPSPAEDRRNGAAPSWPR